VCSGGTTLRCGNVCWWSEGEKIELVHFVHTLTHTHSLTHSPSAKKLKSTRSEYTNFERTGILTPALTAGALGPCVHKREIARMSVCRREKRCIRASYTYTKCIQININTCKMPRTQSTYTLTHTHAHT
jgi:hypothetical protein